MTTYEVARRLVTFNSEQYWTGSRWSHSEHDAREYDDLEHATMNARKEKLRNNDVYRYYILTIVNNTVVGYKEV
jgi:hypothetical protein